MEKLIDLSVANFVDATASNAPVPGGGSISALCGSFAAALATMVAGLTVGKKKYAETEEEMKALIEKVGPAYEILLKAVDLDSEAYDQVFQAYKLPKDTDDEKEFRSAAIQQALMHAATVPFSVAKIVNTFLPDITAVAEKGNQNAITDAYVAALCARAAVLGACANARINLSSIKDADFVDTLMADITVIEEAANATEQTVSKLLAKALA